MNTKNTKRRLVASVVAMAMCFSMFVGSTFAWFTDTASSGVNTITAGNLDIELSFKDKATGDYTAVTDKTKLFLNEKGENMLWEPGAAAVAYLKIENKGSLALKYNLAMNVTNEKTAPSVVEGKTVKLSEVLKFGVVESNATYETREAAINAVKAKAKPLSAYAVSGNMEANADAKYLAIVVYMPEETNNDANYTGTTAPSLDIGIKLDATQYTSENDSFGNTYDENANLPVYSSEEVAEAIENAKPGTVVQVGNTADKDVTLSKVNEGVTINGNGPANTTLNVGSGLNVNKKDVTISNATIKNSGESATVSISQPGTTIENTVIDAQNGAIYVVSSGNTEVKGSQITAGYKAIEVYERTEIIEVSDCTIDAVYPINVNSSDDITKLVVKNSTLKGWTSYGSIHSATFTDVTFGKGHGYAYLRPFADTTLTNCKFEEGFMMGYGNKDEKKTITLVNCTYNGTKITAENIIGTLISTADSPDYGYMKTNLTIIVDGVTVVYQ